MSTVSDAMDSATAELRTARQAIDALAGQVTAQLGVKATAAQTAIASFISRPAFLAVFCDPVNGDDTRDGSTPDKARKSLDVVLDDMGTMSIQIILLADTTMRRRRNLYASLWIVGAQRSANAGGWIYYPRTVALLGTAENSPVQDGSTFGSGLWIFGGTILSNYINYQLGDAPAGQTYKGHFHSDFGSNIVLINSTISVQSAAAAAMFSANNNTLNVGLQIALGSGAAGHLFALVAAGQNPNASYNYHTNVTSA